jgi:hypothetical protein
MFRDDMTHSEAIEFFEYNISGSYLGESTPLYVTSIKTIFDHIEEKYDAD